MDIKTNYFGNLSFILSNDQDTHIIVFSWIENLKFLCSNEKILLDCTFNYGTKYFLQLFTIHGFKNQNYIPLVFSLISNKIGIFFLFLYYFVGVNTIFCRRFPKFVEV